jgi:hypothetical protein
MCPVSHFRIEMVDLIKTPWFILVILGLSILIVLFLFSKIRKLQMHRLRRGQTKQSISKKTKTELLTERLKKNILRTCQENHLAGFLFPLKEIYIDLQLLSRPFYFDPEMQLESEPLIFRSLCRVANFPELQSQLPSPTISLIDALRNRNNICITGELGTGKTCLLSSFTSSLIEKEIGTSQFVDYLPIYVQLSDLFLFEDSSSDLFNLLSTYFSQAMKIGDQTELHSLFEFYAEKSKLILLLDGLDEFSKELAEIGFALIENTIKKYPSIRIITTGGPFYTGSMQKIGFEIFSICPLDSESTRKLIKNWENSFIFDTSKNISSLPLFDQIVSSWAEQECKYLSVFETTLRLWKLLDSNSNYTKFDKLIYPLFGSYSTEDNILTILAEIVQESDRSRNIVIDSAYLYSKLRNRFNIYSKTGQSDGDDHLSGEDLSADIRQNSSAKVIDELFERKILKNVDSNVIFTNPSVQAYLANWSNLEPKNTNWKLLLSDCYAYSVLKYNKGLSALITTWILEPEPLLHRNSILAIRLVDENTDLYNNKNKIFQKVLNQIRDESIPTSLRLGWFSLFQRLQDTSYFQLLHFLLKDTSSTIRSIAAMNLSSEFIAKEQSLVLGLLHDSNETVCEYTCVSLFRSWDPFSQKALIDTLTQGNPVIRQFIAEYLAFKWPEGPEILQEVSTVEDTLTRKAMVSGIRLSKTDWAKNKIADLIINDPQWVVRDAATHAAGNPLQETIYFPYERLPLASKSSWLLKYAEKAGFNLPIDDIPVELLLDVIRNGSYEEKMTALEYLRGNRNRKVINLLLDMVKVQSPVRETALQHLEELASQ